MKNILLVEDEENLVNIMAAVLEEEGYNVRKSTSAEEALGILPGYAPDLIISDIKMSGIDGFSMLERIRHQKATKDIPFICLTALDDSSNQARARTLGAAAYMTKPFDVDDLVRLVKQFLIAA